MTTAAKILEQLRSELGEQADDLDYAPLDAIKTEAIPDAEAISFAILFGYTRDRKSGDKHDLWIHMYPPSRSGGHPEIQINAYNGTQHYAKCDTDVVCKNISGCDAAFKSPRTWAKGKLVALAKYYFLEMLAKQEGDKYKFEFGFPITYTFKADLKAICRIFKEEARGPSPFINRSFTVSAEEPTATALQRSSDAQIRSDGTEPTIESEGSSLSDLPVGVSDIDEGQDMGTVSLASNEALSGGGASEPLLVSTPRSMDSEAFNVGALITMDKNEKSIEAEVKTIDEQIKLLHKKRKEQAEQLQQIQSRRDEIFKGLGPAAAYRLGLQVERERVAKKRRPE